MRVTVELVVVMEHEMEPKSIDSAVMEHGSREGSKQSRRLKLAQPV